jgi:hypothetical protein
MEKFSFRKQLKGFDGENLKVHNSLKEALVDTSKTMTSIHKEFARRVKESALKAKPKG